MSEVLIDTKMNVRCSKPFIEVLNRNKKEIDEFLQQINNEALDKVAKFLESLR